MSAVRHSFATPGADARAEWRAVAKTVGRVKVWHEGDRKRVCLEFWLDGVPRRIYSDVDRWQRKIPLTEETAPELLEDIRAEIRKRRNIADALSIFLGAKAPENLLRARWDRYLKQKAREASDGRISKGHLRELKGLASRGYYDSLWERSVFEIDFGVLEDWLAWLAETKPGLSAKTRKHALTALMGCLRWLVKRGDLAAAPDPPEIRVNEHAPAILDDDDRSAILEAIDPAARGGFLAMAYMGLRPSEMRALSTSADQGEYLVVDRAAEDNKANGPTKGTKTRRVRRLPIPPEVREWIDEHISAADRLRNAPLFPNPRGKTETKRWSHSALDRTWNRASMDALQRKAAPLYEGTRHSFATLALNAGAELYHVQRYLGHTDSKTTERYAKLADESLSSVIGARRPAPVQLRTKDEE